MTIHEGDGNKGDPESQDLGEQAASDLLTYRSHDHGGLALLVIGNRYPVESRWRVGAQIPLVADADDA